MKSLALGITRVSFAFGPVWVPTPSPSCSPKGRSLLFISFNLSCILTSGFFNTCHSRPGGFYPQVLSLPDLLLFSFGHQCSFLWETCLEHSYSRCPFSMLGSIRQHTSLFFCMASLTTWNCSVCSHFLMVQNAPAAVKAWPVITRSRLGDDTTHLMSTSQDLELTEWYVAEHLWGLFLIWIFEVR